MNERIFWRVLRGARERRGIAQKAAAEMLGVKPPTLSEQESGRGAVSEDTLIKAAKAYGTSLREMLLEELTEPAAGPGPKKAPAKK